MDDPLRSPDALALRQSPLVSAPPDDLDDILALLDDGAAELKCIWEDHGYRGGIEKGQLAGRRAFLLRQLTARLGLPDADLHERLQTPTPANLDAWANNVIDANRIQDVFVER